MDIAPDVRNILGEFTNAEGIDYRHPAQQAVRAIAVGSVARSSMLTNRDPVTRTQAEREILARAREVYHNTGNEPIYPEDFGPDHDHELVRSHLHDWVWHKLDGTVPLEVQQRYRARRDNLRERGREELLQTFAAAGELLVKFATEIAGGPSPVSTR